MTIKPEPMFEKITKVLQKHNPTAEDAIIALMKAVCYVFCRAPDKEHREAIVEWAYNWLRAAEQAANEDNETVH